MEQLGFPHFATHQGPLISGMGPFLHARSGKKPSSESIRPARGLLTLSVQHGSHPEKHVVLWEQDSEVPNAAKAHDVPLRGLRCCISAITHIMTV